MTVFLRNSPSLVHIRPFIGFIAKRDRPIWIRHVAHDPIHHPIQRGDKVRLLVLVGGCHLVVHLGDSPLGTPLCQCFPNGQRLWNALEEVFDLRFKSGLVHKIQIILQTEQIGGLDGSTS